MRTWIKSPLLPKRIVDVSRHTRSLQTVYGFRNPWYPWFTAGEVQRTVNGSYQIIPYQIRTVSTRAQRRKEKLGQVSSEHNPLVNENDITDDQPEWLKFEDSRHSKNRATNWDGAWDGANVEFSDLGIHPALVESLQNLGIIVPTDIQRRAIPLITRGKDCILASPTGTGKTLSFILPFIQRIYEFHDAVEMSRNNAENYDNPLSHMRPWVVLCLRRDLCAQVCPIFHFVIIYMICVFFCTGYSDDATTGYPRISLNPIIS